MDDKSVDRILAETRAAPGGEKIDLSRFNNNVFGNVRAKRALGSDIETMVVLCNAADGIRSRSVRTKRRSTLDQLDDILHKGQAVLKADPETAKLITMSCPPRNPDILSTLASGKSVVAQVQKGFSDTVGFEGQTHTLIVTLVGKLMIVFRDHFGAEPGYTKKDNEVEPDGPSIIDSPFIRFVNQALRFRATARKCRSKAKSLGGSERNRCKSQNRTAEGESEWNKRQELSI